MLLSPNFHKDKSEHFISEALTEIQHCSVRNKHFRILGVTSEQGQTQELYD